MTRSKDPLLLIDPYKNLLQAYSLLLGELGFPLDTATSLQEAQSLLSGGKYALIISEILYPLEKWLPFWRETKKENPEAFLLVLTDMVLNDQDYGKFFDSGADDLVGKPCSPEKLLIHIRRGLHYRDLKVTADRLKKLALLDPLTEAARKVILDSAYFRQCLRQEMKKARRHRESFSLVMVNAAKRIDQENDSEEFIHELAVLLGRNTREEDLLGREGQAFGLILPRTGKEGSQVLTDRLNGALHQYPPFQEGPLRELLNQINFETFTYPEQSDLPEPFSRLLTENSLLSSLH